MTGGSTYHTTPVQWEVPLYFLGVGLSVDQRWDGYMGGQEVGGRNQEETWVGQTGAGRPKRNI